MLGGYFTFIVVRLLVTERQNFYDARRLQGSFAYLAESSVFRNGPVAALMRIARGAHRQSGLGSYS